MIVLETERLYLRQWVPDDWVRFKPLLVDPRVSQYVPQRDWTDERIQSHISEYTQQSRTRGWTLWPVIHRADSRFIGFCGFGDEDSPEVGMGWRLLPEYWGQGLATEAVAATLQHGFSTWGFPLISAHAQIPNKASIRIMEKIGMTYDGTGKLHGCDVVRYVIRNPRNVSPDAASSLLCRKATLQDAPLLARMNQHLIEDEGSCNPMSIAELEARMTGWLSGDWRVSVIEQDGVPVGYMLYQFRNDEYRPSETVVYLRQFFIGREYRSRGIGRRAFGMMSEAHFLKASSVVLDVLVTNPRARQFWEVIGLRPYCTTMKLTPCPTR